jgi:hypothetical protein
MFILVLLLSPTIHSIFFIEKRTKPVLPVETFIREQFQLPNGLLLTTIGGNPSEESWAANDREVLSESVGLWLLYVTTIHDEKNVKETIKLLKKYYVSPESTVYWKLDDTGRPIVQTNALIDDLRILAAIEQAANIWNRSSYKRLAQSLSNAMERYSINNGLLVDFYDRVYRKQSDTITLAYIDGAVLQQLSNRISNKKAIEDTLTILQEAEDTPFFPKAYHVREGYIQTPEVHMVEQLYTALHRAQLGSSSERFFQFLQSELENGIMYGRYDSQTLAPSVPFESPSVYALTVLFALEIDENLLAQKAYEKMKKLQTLDPASPYYGGYVDERTGQTHIFDNLLPLLAERRFIDAHMAK